MHISPMMCLIGSNANFQLFLNPSEWVTRPMINRLIARMVDVILDGAEVIAISKKGNFGVIKCTDNSIKPIPIKYLAICKYESDKVIYLFMCNDNIEVEQDSIFDSVEDAKNHAVRLNKNLVWERGIKHISFDDVDFQNGIVKRIEGFGEDMLEIEYPNGYMIDVGYIESINSFVITTVKDDDWSNILREIKAKSDTELKRMLKEAIEWIKANGGLN